MDREGGKEFRKRSRWTLGEEEDDECRWRRMSEIYKEHRSAGRRSQHGTVY